MAAGQFRGRRGLEIAADGFLSIAAPDPSPMEDPSGPALIRKLQLKFSARIAGTLREAYWPLAVPQGLWPQTCQSSPVFQGLW